MLQLLSSLNSSPRACLYCISSGTDHHHHPTYHLHFVRLSTRYLHLPLMSQCLVKFNIHIGKDSSITITVTLLTCHHWNQTLRTGMGMRTGWGHTLAGAGESEILRREVVVDTVRRELLLCHQSCNSLTPKVKRNTRTLKINVLYGNLPEVLAEAETVLHHWLLFSLWWKHCSILFSQRTQVDFITDWCNAWEARCWGRLFVCAMQPTTTCVAIFVIVAPV